MLGTRYEEYQHFENKLPFVLHSELKRSAINYSKEKNWHEDLEIQICEKGSGSVLLNGEKKSFEEGDIVVVNSNIIHYTGTDSFLTYSCIIINSDFLTSVGIEYDRIIFCDKIKDAELQKLMCDLKKIYSDTNEQCRVTKLYSVLLALLCVLCEKYSSQKNSQKTGGQSFETVKSALKYIRKNYSSKITLDQLSRAVHTNKYTLCRDFKKIAGQTVVEYINSYRTQRAADYISSGYTVAEAARLCGFENISFFTKTFKKNLGVLPSSYKKR